MEWECIMVLLRMFNRLKGIGKEGRVGSSDECVNVRCSILDVLSREPYVQVFKG